VSRSSAQPRDLWGRSRRAVSLPPPSKRRGSRSGHCSRLGQRRRRPQGRGWAGACATPYRLSAASAAGSASLRSPVWKPVTNLVDRVDQCPASTPRQQHRFTIGPDRAGDVERGHHCRRGRPAGRRQAGPVNGGKAATAPCIRAPDEPPGFLQARHRCPDPITPACRGRAGRALFWASQVPSTAGPRGGSTSGRSRSCNRMRAVTAAKGATRRLHLVPLLQHHQHPGRMTLRRTSQAKGAL